MVYEKGAWVLQMLRNLMMDTRTMSDDAFTATMQDFYQQYRGRRASTSDFQRVVEQHVRAPMGWFFKEWIDGTALPTYTFAWRAEQDSVKRWTLHLRVAQEGVPDDFVMLVPLLIQFGDAAHAIVRVRIGRSAGETSMRVPAQPTQVELNPLESVLAEVKQQNWQ
jgi:aminopeptidase N